MPGIYLGNVTLYEVFYYFILYSFFGWILESIYVSIRAKKLINRGFLNGPFCPIYAVGALSAFFILSPIKVNIIYVYLGGCILATLLEYIIGYAMEKAFHAKWWDYSCRKFNINGRVCLGTTLSWGFLSILMMYAIQPNVEKFVENIPIETGSILALFLIVYLISDSTVTIYNVIKLNGKLERLKGSVLDIQQNLMNFIELDITDEFKLKLKNSISTLGSKLPSVSNLKEPEFIEDIKSYIDQKKEPSELKLYLEDKYKKLRDALEKYKSISFKKNGIQDRILKAYPHIKWIGLDEYLNQLKSIIINRKIK